MYVHNTYVLERDMNMYACPILQHTFHLWEYARMDIRITKIKKIEIA